MRNLARAILDQDAPDLLPLLADALLDAGCTDEELLALCRAAEWPDGDDRLTKLLLEAAGRDRPRPDRAAG